MMRVDPLLGANRELTGRLYSLVDSLAALNQLSGLDIRGSTESELIDDALALLVKHQDLEHCLVFLRNGDGFECAALLRWTDRLPVRTAAGPTTDPVVPQAFLSRVSDAGESVLVTDCAAELAPVAEDEAPARGSLLGVPIKGGGSPLGILVAHHSGTERISPWQEHSLALFSGVLGHLLDHHRLMRRMEETVTARTRQLETALREAEQLKRRYEQLSNVDELTELHNRRFFFPEAEAAVSRALRYGQHLSVLLFDIDHFKRINDTYGHAVGDRVLRDVAQVLQKVIREGDILARFGGEEFAMVLPSTDLDGGAQLAQRVRKAVSDLQWEVAGEAVSVSISIGLTRLIPDEAANSSGVLEVLLREADEALYHCKSHGRDRVSAYPLIESEGRAATC